MTEDPGVQLQGGIRMATWWKGLCLGVLVSWTMAGPARGQSFNMNVSADGIKLGTPVSGPKLSAADLKGKVVFLEFWGIN